MPELPKCHYHAEHEFRIKTLEKSCIKIDLEVEKMSEKVRAMNPKLLLGIVGLITSLSAGAGGFLGILVMGYMKSKGVAF